MCFSWVKIKGLLGKNTIYLLKVHLKIQNKNRFKTKPRLFHLMCTPQHTARNIFSANLFFLDKITGVRFKTARKIEGKIMAGYKMRRAQVTRYEGSFD